MATDSARLPGISVIWAFLKLTSHVVIFACYPSRTKSSPKSNCGAGETSFSNTMSYVFCADGGNFQTLPFKCHNVVLKITTETSVAGGCATFPLKFLHGYKGPYTFLKAAMVLVQSSASRSSLPPLFLTQRDAFISKHTYARQSLFILLYLILLSDCSSHSTEIISHVQTWKLGVTSFPNKIKLK